MGQFKPMTKMMTTEPSVILKLKKGGHVESKREEMGEHGHAPMSKGNGLMVAIAIGKGKKGAPDGDSPKKPSMSDRRKAMAAPFMKKGGKVAHKMNGGAMGAPMAPAAMPMPMPAVRKRRPMMAPPVVVPARAPAMAPAGMPAGMPARAAMKKGGSTDDAQDKAMIKKAFKQHDSQEHQGSKGTKLALKKGGMMGGGKACATGGVAKGNGGGYATGGVAKGNAGGYATGGVAKGNAGGYKKGGKIKKFEVGGMVPESPVSDKPTSPLIETGGTAGARGGGGGAYGGLDTVNAGAGQIGKSLGEVNQSLAQTKQAAQQGSQALGGGQTGIMSTLQPGSGLKKGGSAKKAYATGGSVNDTGRPVAMPKHVVSKPVSNTAQSGTFKKGGKVSRFDEGGDVIDTSRGGYASFEKAKREEDMPLANSIRNAPGKAYDAIRRLLGNAPEAASEPVKEAGAGRGFINPPIPSGARR